VTPEEYMDKNQFPKTTGEGYTLDQQLFMDAFNYDQFKENVVDEGLEITEDQKVLWKELSEKVAAQSEVRAAMKKT
jgi:hypothetical protein